jgi:hypothetical protein
MMLAARKLLKNFSREHDAPPFYIVMGTNEVRT